MWVAGLVLSVDRAVEPGKAVIEHYSPVRGHRVGDAVEALADRRGELTTDHVVLVGENRDAEVPGAAEVRPRLRGRREVDRRVAPGSPGAIGTAPSWICRFCRSTVMFELPPLPQC